MTASIIGVIGVVAAGVLGAVINQAWTGHNAARGARRDYEYDAKKKLLAGVQPILFELSERCNEGFWRIFGIAQSEYQGRLNPTTCPTPRFQPKSQYYLPSTVYRLITPLVLLHMLEGELGRFDFSLVPEATSEYRLAKKLYRTWNSGEPLAKCDPPMPYHPVDVSKDKRAVLDPELARQHVRLGAIDNVVDLLTIQEADGTTRCARYGEFQDIYDAMRHEKIERKASGEPWSSPQYAALNRVTNIFVDFSPATKPVLWRILMAQAVLLQWIALDFQPDESHSLPAVVAVVESRFDGLAKEPWVQQGLRAARSYLSAHTG